MSRFRTGLIALALATLPASAQAQTLPKIMVVLPNPPATYMLPLYMAQASGAYKRAGIEVEAKTVGGDQNSLRAVITGSGDVAVIGPPVLYEALANGAKIKTVGSWQATTDYFLVMAKDKATSLREVVGKSLAVSTPGSMPHLIPQMMFKKNGLDGGNTRYVAIGGLSVRMQAVMAGKVDGTITDTMNALRGERAQQVNIVTSTTEQFPEGLAYIYLTVSEANLQDPVRRKALHAFIKGSIEGAREVVDQPDRAAEIFYERVSKDVDLDLMKASVKKLNEQKVWGLNGGIEEHIHDFTLRAYMDFHVVDHPVPYKEAFDPSLVDAAVKEIGRR